MHKFASVGHTGSTQIGCYLSAHNVMKLVAGYGVLTKKLKIKFFNCHNKGLVMKAVAIFHQSK